MARRIIDKYTEDDDKEEPLYDWKIFATPFAEAIKIDAKEDLSTLYVRHSVDMASKNEVSTEKFRDIKTLPNDIIDVRSALTLHRSQPVVLVGEAGVGKTSWLKYFSEIVLIKERSISFHYDQKVDFNIPIKLEGTPEDNFLRLFWYLLIDKIKSELNKRGLTGTKISSIISENIVEYSKPELLTLYKIIESEIKILYEQSGITLFVLIDNIDQFDTSLQKEAFGLSVWLSSIKGIISFVALRPDTMNDKLFSKSVHNPLIYYISPPKLEQLLESRLEYLWSADGANWLSEARSILEDESITINLSYTGMLNKNERNLKSFHTNIKRLLCSGRLLENTLYSLHNGNIREVSQILSSIILTKYFSKEFREGTLEEPTPKLKYKEQLITAYLRGIYTHYRGGTTEYPVANISLLADLPDDNTNAILGIRVLQILFIRKAGEKFGVLYSDLFGILKSVAYTEKDIKKILVMLFRRNFITETVRQANIETVDDVKKSDRFRLKPSGEFVLTTLLQKYAFRYCEAIADISPHPITTGTWSPDKSYPHLSLVKNAFGILEFFIRSAEIEKENLRKLSVERSDKLMMKHLKDEFYSDDEILKIMFLECSGRAKYFSNGIQSRANYDAANEFRQIIEHSIPSLKQRIDKLQYFD